MNVIPQNYNLEFFPDFKNFTFDGVTTITINCLEPTTVIKLDAVDIMVESCSCSIDGVVFNATFSVGDGQLAIDTHRSITGECEIKIKYRGILNDKLVGFYRSSYKVGNETKYLATTQFEAADARRAFPCFDRPDLKATFDIRVHAPAGMTVVSNMPIKYTTELDNGYVFVFRTTPKMSTYLVYMGVGEFEYLVGSGKIRIVTTAGKSKHGKFAMELAERLMPLYENYFSRFYRLPKLDLLAIPDFGSGAMENWGAITFRENLLLYDEKNSSNSTKQLVAEVVSHELAHQWFGNLVTMEWWNDLWLNESFATFMATKTLDWLYPNWNLWDQFVNSASRTAMEMDALNSTHPIDVKVNSPSQIREIFDAISYEKGGSLLRMIEEYAGKLTFRGGLRLYIKDFEYKNATGKDLWDSIDDSIRRSRDADDDVSNEKNGETANMSVHKIMEPWLSMSGFPMIRVTREDDIITLTQSQFQINKDGGDKLWPIPVVIRGRPARKKIVMDKKTLSLVMPGKFIVNYNRLGFYRVMYEKEILDQMKEAVETKAITSMNRWSVQNDLFAMCLAGKTSILDYLDFVGAYRNERQYMPLANIGENLSLLLNMSHGQDWNNNIRDVSTPIFNNILKWLGWKPHSGEPHTHSFLRTLTILSLGRLDENISDKTADMFAGYADNPGTVHPDMRRPVFAAVARHGGAGVHSKLSGMFASANSAEEQARILFGLCEFDNPRLLTRTLDFAISNKVRTQNVHSFIINVASNPESRGMLWPWLSENWDSVVSKVGTESGLLGRIVTGIALATEGSEIDEINEFFTQKKIKGIDRAVKQLLDLTRLYSDFRQRAAQDLQH